MSEKIKEVFCEFNVSLRVILIYVCCLTIFSSASAQKNKWEAGIRSCFSYNSVYGGPSIENIYDPVFDFTVGLSGQYNTLRNLAIHAELNYERKGAKSDVDFFTADQNGNITKTGTYRILNIHEYLIVPILLRVQTPDRINFYVEAGVYTGYLLKYTIRTQNYPGGEHEFNYTKDFRRFDYGISCGLGVQFPIGDRLFLSADLRENFGLLDMYKHPSSSGNQLKNNSVTVGCILGYRFGWREQK